MKTTKLKMALLGSLLLAAVAPAGCDQDVSVTVRLNPTIPDSGDVEYEFKLDEKFGDYDLTDNVWPDFTVFGAPFSGIPLAGNIYDYKVSSGYDMHMCMGTRFDGSCFTVSSASLPADQWTAPPVSGHAKSIEISKTSWGQFPDYSEMTPYPFEAELDWHYRAQGITHLGDSWYITNVEDQEKQLNYIFRVPVSKDLGVPGQYTAMAAMPTDADWEGCSHFGDPDAFGDLIVVPVQGCKTGRRLAIYDADLNLKGFKTIRPTDVGGSEDIAAWIAFNPNTGLMYTSRYDNCDRVYVYKFHDTKEPDFVDYAYTIYLHKTLDRVQGGDISDTGHLYLSSDGNADHPESGTHGIYVFRVLGKNAELQRTIGFSKYVAGSGRFYSGDEVEGMDLWDLSLVDDKHASLGEGGQVHLVVVDLDLGVDDFTLKHFAADEPLKL
ncbi:MAG: hypothetical protein QM820_45315 [Minicystis sp.]